MFGCLIEWLIAFSVTSEPTDQSINDQKGQLADKRRSQQTYSTTNNMTRNEHPKQQKKTLKTQPKIHQNCSKIGLRVWPMVTVAIRAIRPLVLGANAFLGAIRVWLVVTVAIRAIRPLVPGANAFLGATSVWSMISVTIIAIRTKDLLCEVADSTLAKR